MPDKRKHLTGSTPCADAQAASACMCVHLRLQICFSWSWAAGPSRRCSPCLIVAGPTASGKSALALELAERLRGTIINADAMQTYRDLRVLTARPRPADEAAAAPALRRPAAAEAGSVAWWRDAALAENAPERTMRGRCRS